MATSAPALQLLGAERPRVELRPPAIYSLAGPAIELAARAGMVLEPWQADGLEIMMSVRPDGKWAAFEYGELCPRQNGKTALFAVRALAGLLLLGERLIMWTAHEYKTALESFILMQGMLEELGEVSGPRRNLIDLGDGVLIKVNNTNGEEEFARLDTRQRLKFLARSKGSGRGFSGDVNLIDEAFAYTPAHQSALMPTMNARPNPQICYASSPPLDSESGEVLFGLRGRVEKGGEVAEGLGWRDWGLTLDLDELERLDDDARDELLNDRARWAATNPAVGRGRVDEESILRNRRAMKWQDYAREILGCWPVAPEEGGRVIRSQTWADLAAESAIASQPVFGLDVNPERTWCDIAAGGRNADGREHIELIEHRPGMDWAVARAVELDAEHEPAAWLIDPSGPAGPLIDDLEQAGLLVQPVTGREWMQACMGFYDAVNAAQLVHLGDPVLEEAVKAARKREVGDGGWAWGRRSSGVNIAPLCAVTLARHGIAKYVSDLVDNVW